LNIKSRYAALLILLGSLTILFGAALKAEDSMYTNLLFISGLLINFIGAIVLVINMYHKRRN